MILFAGRGGLVSCPDCHPQRMRETLARFGLPSHQCRGPALSRINQKQVENVSVIVQKFGGTSVADATKIKAAAERAVKKMREGHQVVVVVSARGKKTDELVSLAHEISLSLTTVGMSPPPSRAGSDEPLG